MNKMILFIFTLFVIKTTFANNQIESTLEGQFYQTLDRVQVRQDYQTLTMAQVMSQGLAQSYTEKIRYRQGQLIELNKMDAWESYWFPEISLNFATIAQRVGTLKGDKSAAEVPSGALSLSLGNYTVFNWGKDYLSYTNSISTFNRQLEANREEHRDLKHELILQYFQTVSLKEMEQVRRKQLRHASFIYRYTREQLAKGKLGRDDFMMARDEYLKAQSEFFHIKSQVKVADEEMARLINDPVGTQYVMDETINYVPLKIPLEEAIEKAQKQNPNVLQALTDLQVAKTDYELALKENLPLPKFTLDLGAYRYGFSPTSAGMKYINGPKDTLEIVATINASWTILGSGGLFNRRERSKALIDHQIRRHQVEDSQHTAASLVKQYIETILNYQTQIQIMDAKYPNAEKLFDRILTQYMQQKRSFLYFKDYLKEYVDTEIHRIHYRYEHLKNKILLAKAIGSYDFPNENFDHLAKKVE